MCRDIGRIFDAVRAHVVSKGADNEETEMLGENALVRRRVAEFHQDFPNGDQGPPGAS
jgi:hypothetical protein